MAKRRRHRRRVETAELLGFVTDCPGCAICDSIRDAGFTVINTGRTTGEPPDRQSEGSHRST